MAKASPNVPNSAGGHPRGAWSWARRTSRSPGLSGGRSRVQAAVHDGGGMGAGRGGKGVVRIIDEL